MKKFLAIMLVLVMAVSLFAGCGETATPTPTEPGSVYYLNFKPEQDEAWQALAAKYTEATGIEVTVVTAASGTYEPTLKSEIAKTEAPTLFQVNGPVGLANWKDYCYDLSGSKVYGELTNEGFALKNGSEVAGIAYVVETYGIIYNKTILDTYFTKDYAAVKSVEEINSFAKLKEVADSIQANAADLGVKGAFTSAGMDSSSDWRFKTHLANLPLYYEFVAENYEGQPAAIKGSYLDNYKNIWDLYITDSTCDKTVLSSKTGDDSLAEFCKGDAVFYQNGTWAWCEDMESTVGAENLGMLPIYVGVEGEENQGLCTGSENYWCVNKNAAPEDIQATLDFLYWVVSSEDGTTALAEDMGFVSPFKSAKPSTNPLIKIAEDYAAAGKAPVGWYFSTMPSENWKNVVGQALNNYAQGTGDWAGVVTAFVDGWATEVAAVAAAQA